MMLDLLNKEFRQPEDPVSVNIISVPAEELEEFNQHIIGLIEVTQSFPNPPTH